MSQNKARILIVDDDPNLSRLAAVVLEQTNLYEIKIENQPISVVSVVRQYRPDLILLDVDMPGKDGGDLEREIRADASLGDTPILFLTALISPREAGAREIYRGGSYFLAKPVEPAVLLQSVERMLQTHAQNKAKRTGGPVDSQMPHTV